MKGCKKVIIISIFLTTQKSPGNGLQVLHN